MTATDLAEAVMEGFTDKTYEQIVNLPYGADITGDSTLGISPLSSINNNVYNLGSNATAISVADMSSYITAGDAAGIVSNGVKLNSTNITANRFENQIKINNRFMAVCNTKSYTAGTGQMLYYYRGPADDISMFLVFNDVSFEGYTFDICVSLLPCAQSDTDKYYPYSVLMCVYDNVTDSVDSSNLLTDGINPVLTYNAGIKNK